MYIFISIQNSPSVFRSAKQTNKQYRAAKSRTVGIFIRDTACFESQWKHAVSCMKISYMYPTCTCTSCMYNATTMRYLYGTFLGLLLWVAFIVVSFLFCSLIPYELHSKVVCWPRLGYKFSGEMSITPGILPSVKHVRILLSCFWTEVSHNLQTRWVLYSW